MDFRDTPLSMDMAILNPKYPYQFESLKMVRI